MDLDIPSPCTKVCTIDAATGWCVGCLRTIDEIAAWGSLDGAAKRAVWKRLPERRAERDRRDASSIDSERERREASSIDSPAAP